MLSEYTDILETVTLLLRDSHFWIKKDGDGPASNCADEIDPVTGLCRCVAKPRWHDEHGVPRFMPHHPDWCPNIYADEVALLRIACQACARESLVQMSHGRPEMVRELAMSGTHGAVSRLLEEALQIGLGIGTQALQIGRILGAQPKATSELAEMIAAISMRDSAERIRLAAIATELAEQRKYRPPTLADQVTAGVIHYGDPPNIGCCAAGPTMNCDDLAVVEFWRRGRSPSGPVTLGEAMDAMGWSRVPELEHELPDRKNRSK